MGNQDKDAADSQQRRERVRQVAGEAVGESVSLVHLPVNEVVYRVRGLKRDGSAPQGFGRRFVRAMLLLPQLLRFLVLWLFIEVICVILLDSPPDIDLPESTPGKIKIRGRPGCAALGFAQQLRVGEDVWLGWSSSQVVLLSESAHVLWWAGGNERPEVVLRKRRLRWPDGSRVRFHLSRSERKRIAAADGAP